MGKHKFLLMPVLLIAVWLVSSGAWAAPFTCNYADGSDCDWIDSSQSWDCLLNTCYVCNINAASGDPILRVTQNFSGNVTVRDNDCIWNNALVKITRNLVINGAQVNWSNVDVDLNGFTVSAEATGFEATESTILNASNDVSIKANNIYFSEFTATIGNEFEISGNNSIANSSIFNVGSLVSLAGENNIASRHLWQTSIITSSDSLRLTGDWSFQNSMVSVLKNMEIENASFEWEGYHLVSQKGLEVHGNTDSSMFDVTNSKIYFRCPNANSLKTMVQFGPNISLRVFYSTLQSVAHSDSPGNEFSGVLGNTWNGIKADSSKISFLGKNRILDIAPNEIGIDIKANKIITDSEDRSIDIINTEFDSGLVGVRIYQISQDGGDEIHLGKAPDVPGRIVIENCIFQGPKQPIKIDVLDTASPSIRQSGRVDLKIANNMFSKFSPPTSEAALNLQDVKLNGNIDIIGNNFDGSGMPENTWCIHLDTVEWGLEESNTLKISELYIHNSMNGLSILNIGRWNSVLGSPIENVFGVIIEDSQIDALRTTLYQKNALDNVVVRRNSLTRGFDSSPATSSMELEGYSNLVIGGEAGQGNCFTEERYDTFHIGPRGIMGGPIETICTYNGFNGQLPRINSNLHWCCTSNTEQACGGSFDPVYDCLIDGQPYTEGTHPENSCMVCDPCSNVGEWTVLPNGTPCPNGTCDEGSCTGSCNEGCFLENYCYGVGVSPRDCIQCGPDGNWIPFNEGMPCNDSLFCTINETCQNGTCVGENRECPAPTCYFATCWEEQQICLTHHEENGTPCDDHNICTVNDHCQDRACEGEYIACPEPVACKSEGVCVNNTGECYYSSLPDGTPCDDNNACTNNDHCIDGECIADPDSFNCDDGNPCTIDTCNPERGGCDYMDELDGSPCSSGSNFCWVDETCQNGVCQGGNLRECADLNPWDCNDFICDSISEQCVTERRPADSACTDASACNGLDRCDSNGECTTHEFTDETVGPCEHVTTCVDRNSGKEIQINDEECAGIYCREQTLNYICECDVMEAYLKDCGPIDFNSNFCNMATWCKEGNCLEHEPSACIDLLENATGLNWENVLNPCSNIGCYDTEGLRVDQRCYLEQDGGNLNDCIPPNPDDPCRKFRCEEIECNNANHPTNPDKCWACNPYDWWKDEESCDNGKVCKWIEGAGRSLCLLKDPRSTTLGTGGGALTHTEGAGVEIPAGALTQETEIVLSPADYAPAYTHPIGPVFRFGPSGQSFNAPVTVTLPFDESLADPNFAITAYWTAKGDEDTWEPIGGERIGTGLWQVEVTHFSLGVVGLDATLCPAGCKIGAICYNPGERNPDNNCLMCDPSVSVSDWTTLETGAQCNDYNPCSLGDSCTQGECVGYEKTCPPSSPDSTNLPPPGTVTEDACWEYTGNACNPDTGKCEYTVKDDGEPCDVFDLCYDATCQVGVCVLGQRRQCEDNICGTYDCNSDSGDCEIITPRNDGQQCNEPTVCATYVCGEGDCQTVAKPGSDGESCGDGMVCESGFCVEKGCGCNGDPLTLVRVADASDGSGSTPAWKKRADAALSLLVIAILALGLTLWRRRGYRRLVG